MRNPNWTRDELILTLDFYKRYSPSIPDKHSKEIAALSEQLNKLATIVGDKPSDTYRNPNGVYMKLMNFRRFDPESVGVGLQRGGKDEEIVWDEFSDDAFRLRTAAHSIRSHIEEIDSFPEGLQVPSDGTEEASEGRLLTRVHVSRERNQQIVSRKKHQFEKQHGGLFCEACGFDFESVYGERGRGFIECHHTKPVSELNAGEKTNINDLSLLCSNCHRMVHRERPWLSMEQLKALTISGKKQTEGYV